MSYCWTCFKNMTANTLSFFNSPSSYFSPIFCPVLFLQLSQRLSDMLTVQRRNLQAVTAAGSLDETSGSPSLTPDQLLELFLTLFGQVWYADHADSIEVMQTIALSSQIYPDINIYIILYVSLWKSINSPTHLSSSFFSCLFFFLLFVFFFLPCLFIVLSANARCCQP